MKKGVEVFDLDKELNKVKVNSQLDDPMRQFFVYDPDGNLVELVDAENEFFKRGLSK